MQHTVILTVGAQRVDVTLELTFFEQWSVRERRAMDADRNGIITRAEQDAYLKRIEADLCRQVKLFVAGREMPLASLYPPEIDLLANTGVGPAHHRLRLFFFAASPVSLRAGDEIVVEDRLWLQANALTTPRVEADDGCGLATGLPADIDSLPGTLGQQRLITFKCLQRPSIKPPAQADRRRTPVTTLPVPLDPSHETTPLTSPPPP